MIYIFIAILLCVQVAVVVKTKKLTDQQRNIFEDDANKYKVDEFYIPKNEIAKISYEKILNDKKKYKTAGDTYVTVEKNEYDEETGGYKKVKIQELICRRADKISINLVQINPSNDVAIEIQRVTNNYLIRNKGAASDYGLIKDIVERNCSSIEEEIEAQTPWPLYFGLMGTMAGIIYGVGSIGLNEGFEQFVQHPELYIGNLMGDVASAMIVSFFGIGFTTYLSHLAKSSKTIVETKKNSFYSWFQAELMPIITKENATEGLRRLEDNLNRFNDSFETNVKELSKTFTLVKGTAKDQATILTSLENMDLPKMASANVKIITKFNETVGRLEDFNAYIEYAQKVLDEIKGRNDAVKEVAISVEDNLDKVFNHLKNSTEKQIETLKQSLIQSGDALDKLVAQEDKLVAQQGNKIEAFFNTIQELKPIINGLNDWKKELQRQSSEIGRLASSIDRMPVSDGNGNVIIPKKGLFDGIVGYIGIGAVMLIAVIMTINVFFMVSLSNTMEEIKNNQSVQTVSSVQETDSVVNNTDTIK